MNEAFLMIGGNLGERITNLQSARKEIEKRCGTIIKASSIYETAAWGIEEQSKFLNQALYIHTALSPSTLLSAILQIEEDLGRIRKKKYGPRIIDIDILFYNNEILELEELTIPHPEIQNRKFVLVPLTEINASFIHPVLNHSIDELLQMCTDTLDVYKII
ncbi:MAG TPA: 2-amino-4-hydroxy-6-hydroxymethyldihydropteridine diphosphokinase [Flavisolibacter sp.]|nr:2-amino-4-hydroxy-6-hydroxymethyldihydropteridine diphosphokinase [Flavisolibacter sp.]